MSALELFLDSIRLSPPGAKWQFMWNKRDKNRTRSFVGSIGFEFYVDLDKRKRASLMLIREYAALLEGFSIEKASDLLGEFFYEGIEIIGMDSLFFNPNTDQTVSALVHPLKMAVLKNELKKFLSGRLQQVIFCMPVEGISCLAQNVQGNLMWVPGNFNLSGIVASLGVSPDNVISGVFPPISNWKYRRYDLTAKDSWFVVKTHDESIAEAYFRRMSGALSVTILHPYAHRISGRELNGGRISFKPDGTSDFNFNPPTVPAVLEPFKVNPQIESLFWELCREDCDSRIHICLEYLSESWGKSRVISFINCSIAMDALFGINGQVRQSILNGVQEKAGHIEDVKERYSLILDMRNGILHGEFSSLEASPTYLEYYDRFNVDPVGDQRRIIGECLYQISKEGVERRGVKQA